jgi:hypothetical protein
VNDADLDRFVERSARTGATSARKRAPIHPVRIVLVAATWIVLAFLLWPTRDELLAHFQRAQPIDIPDPTALKGGSSVPLGATVRVHAVLGNRAASLEGWRQGSLRMGPVEVRQVLGAPLFVEYDAKRYPRFGTFTEVEIVGRTSSFGPDTEIPEVRKYLEGQGIEIPSDARLITLDEGAGRMSRYLLAWTGGLSLAIFSLMSLLRRRAVA